MDQGDFYGYRVFFFFFFKILRLLRFSSHILYFLTFHQNTGYSLDHVENEEVLWEDKSNLPYSVPVLSENVSLLVTESFFPRGFTNPLINLLVMILNSFGWCLWPADILDNHWHILSDQSSTVKRVILPVLQGFFHNLIAAIMSQVIFDHSSLNVLSHFSFVSFLLRHNFSL